MKILSDEGIRAIYNKLKMEPPSWIPEIDKAIAQAQLDKLKDRESPMYLDGKGQWQLKDRPELEDVCPKCGNKTLIVDSYSKQSRCLRVDCDYCVSNDRPDRTAIAKLLAYQTLVDEDKETIESTWKWVVDAGFTEEWYENADQILALIDCSRCEARKEERDKCKKCTEWDWIQKHVYHSNNIEAEKEGK